MTRLIAIAILMVPMVAASHITAKQDKQTLCEFAPENDMKIPVHGFNANNAMTEEIFNEVLDNIYEVYQPKIAARGATFDLQRDWQDSTVNAYAQRSGNTWIIKMFGGLARHQDMTPDGFAMVACHEIGHHLGGAPKKTDWVSNEGQSDYFATLKCARFIWERMNNFAAVMGDIQTGSGDPVAREKCAAAHGSNLQLQSVCVRASMAGLSLAKVLASLGRESAVPAFNTPDSAVVGATNHRHPRAQCRLDTYFAGALCEMNKETELSDNDSSVGTCSRRFGATTGVRPRCWFKPERSLDDQEANDITLAFVPAQ